jgi:hypothetical protein
MKASLPQFCAASALVTIVVAVVTVARPYPDASGSNVDVLGERRGGNGNGVCTTLSWSATGSKWVLTRLSAKKGMLP